MHVLIVEDDPEINQLLCAYAQIAGFTPEPALDGETAQALLASRAFSLVLLDVMLPDIDGLEICRRVRASGVRATAEVPIVMLTALTAESTRRSADACGVAAYLTKPFDPDELILVLRKFARRAD